MVDDAFGLAIEDRADLEVALEFAQGLFDFEKVFVVVLDLHGIGMGDGEVAVEEILAVEGGLGGDGVLFAFPLEDAGTFDAVGEVFVGFELLEGASGLAGDFLGVGFGALGGGDGENDLRSVGGVIAAMPLARARRETGALKIDAGEAVERKADGLFECLICEFFSKAHR
jgi:hypothetical protein